MLFEPQDTPRIFCTPLGVDFSAELIAGLDARLADAPPHAMAEVEIFVASDRMRRRLEALFAQGPARIMPKLTPVGRIADRPELSLLPPALTPLGLRLRLVTLISALLDTDPRLAPRSALYDLADSLANLMAEMQEEGVTPAEIAGLQTEDLAKHWERNAAFLNIIAQYFGPDMAGPVPMEARQTLAVDWLARLWAENPPQTPVLVAGSTGSRGGTARLMEAVARLPQGAVVLPGMDRDMPGPVWSRLLKGRKAEGLAGEDHPQFRLGRFAGDRGVRPHDVPCWTRKAPVAPSRNAWLSLSLRPAPVTDAWLREAPSLPDSDAAFADVTLLEAPSPRAEAAAIALRLREAAETGQKATLVTPDRTLARAVTAALDRWGILPDDSAGLALDLTPPGRLLALMADVMAVRADAVRLLAALKHPLTHAGADRDLHLRQVNLLELKLLRGGPLYPQAHHLDAWVADHGGDPVWAAWVAETLLGGQARKAPLTHLVEEHQARTKALAAGSTGGSRDTLWEGSDAATAAKERMRAVAADAEAGGELSARDYRDLITAILRDAELRNPVRPHAGVMIWGAMEARVQGADLMILGGLNDGTWPAGDVADPWLNRTLRGQAGLRLPDRRTGLSAHDYQQAATAPEVWLSRSVRDAETETVPSRWLNRLTNLLDGSGPGPKGTLQQMRARGGRYLAMAEALSAPGPDMPRDRAKRTAPAPPALARPRTLSVTQIEKLIRDPFAIYASKVLGLAPLDPLRPLADARLKGTILHDILHRFIDETREGLSEDAEARLLAIAAEELDRAGEWPVARHLWQAALAKAAPAFLAGERDRRRVGTPWALEQKAEAEFAPPGVKLKAKADRVDQMPDGRLAIYDYKSGKPPTEKQERLFNKQLRLEASMAALGAFGGSPHQTAKAAFVGLAADGPVLELDLTPEDIAQTTAQLLALWASYLAEDQGFAPRRAMKELNYPSDFEHLARYGEWDEADEVMTVQVGQ